MPAGGSTFSVRYPSGDTPELSTQTYSGTEALPHDKMLFTAENCQLSKMTFELEAQYSALQLNLYGSKAVGSIVVTTNETPEKTYTLDCMGTGSGTEPGKTNEPKPFYIVVPAGSYGFTVTINDVSSGVISQKSTTSDQTFVANEFLKMPPLGYPGTDKPVVKIGDVIWAPVNCGYEPATATFKGYPYGKLYQWGRKDGQGYDSDDASYPSGDNLVMSQVSDLTTLGSDKFYYGNGKWYNGTTPAANSLWGKPKTDYDPCPAGWRVPTNTELNAIISTKLWITNGGPSSDQSGYLFGTSPNQVFLPAAGYRDCSSSSEAQPAHCKAII